MKFPLSLLHRFLKTDATLNTITETLTRIGLEVEGVEDASALLAPFEVAEILHAEKHPEADRLRVCRVNTGAGELQIVCGAPNARAGIKVALAKVGVEIPTNGLKIKASKIRGVESNGMLCSADELGLNGDAEGIIELPATAIVGQSIVPVLGLNDPVIELSITPNRGDCFGVMGVARDLAAAGIGEFIAPALPNIATSNGDALNIQIADTHACPQFIGRRITGLKNGPSPEWLQRTLTQAGMRPISALVDVTNFFALAYGRPLHVFDAAKVKGALTIRAAQNGETLEALNEKTYQLTGNDCVIADENGVLALGGIMGGAPSGVRDTTTDIILETAMFDPVRIANSARHHQILSDARTRFERGVDPAFLPQADLLATQLILELCGGVAQAPVVAGNAPAPRQPIAFDASFITRLGGLNMQQDDAANILRKLGFRVEKNTATPPGFRHDVSQPADLAEEVLRIIGYDAIPATSLPKPEGHSMPAVSTAQAQLYKAKRKLASLGLYEAVSFAFISQEEAAIFGGGSANLQLQNPIAEQLNTMRPSLLVGLLQAAQHNMARGQKSLALFEAGSVFYNADITGEALHISGIVTGHDKNAHWQPTQPPDMFTVKAHIAALLETYGMDIENCQLSRDVPSWYHPGKAGVVKLGPKVTLGYFGELHPAINRAFDLEQPIFAFEFMVGNVPASRSKKRDALQLSDYQAVTRDFAFLVDQTLQAAHLIKAIRKAAKPLLRDVRIFDVYQGKGVAQGQCSIALSITLQADDRTLSEAEITAVSDAVIAEAAKAGATLRGF